jgi:cytosine deaminase
LNAECDLVISKALVQDAAEPLLSDIYINEKHILGIGRTQDLQGRETLSAEGKLVMPGFVNAHTHLDKADLLSRMTPDQFGYSLEENRRLIREFKGNYTVQEVKERAGKVALEMFRQGTTAIRSQVDVDPTAGLTPLRALLELREELSDKVTIQLSAFPQEGVLKDGAYQLLESALKEGADLLGGLPLVEEGRENQERHIDLLFRLAMKYDKHLDVQVDESNSPEDFVLPYLVEKTLQEGYQGRVAATHCISLAAVEDAAALPVMEKMAEAEMAVIITPSCNLITRFPAKPGSRPHNSITRVGDLLKAGVKVVLGTDNIRDVFYPLGNGSMIREMHVLATTTRMSRMEDVHAIHDMATVNGAALLGLRYGMKKGCDADLLVTGAASKRELICGPEAIPVIIKSGAVVERKK